ncbi:6541_t:CDS:1, partial [Racocetra persica]
FKSFLFVVERFEVSFLANTLKSVVKRQPANRTTLACDLKRS